MVVRAFVLLILLGGGYGVFKWLKKTEKAVENEFKMFIRHSAARWLAPKLNSSESQIETALKQWVNSGKQPSLLAPIIRVECEITRGAKECLVKVTVALEQDGKATIGEVEQKVGWEDLPRDIRDEFIKLGKPTQAFIIVERQQKNEEK